MKIYAIRHGETDLNAEGRVQGCKSDLSLNEEGRKQAHKIADILADKNIDLIVTSPLKRAVETAEIIAERLNIKRDKFVRGLRLYERDFGDYEGKLMSEVDINALRRWTDNAPTPNGETIREVAGRVFDYLDDRLSEMKDIVNRDRRDYLDDQYDKRHGDMPNILENYADYEAKSEIKNNIIRNALNELEVTILFIVHGHVLRTMYWYFNGLPEDGNETVIETDNCGFYEFDTKKIPSMMKDYQIILDRRTLEERLKRLSRSTYKASYTTCFAMCYVPGDFEVRYEDYICAICGKKTKHNSDHISSLRYAKNAVNEVTQARFKIDAFIDEREYCCHCFGKAVDYPTPVLKIRFSTSEEYHEVRTGNYHDYKCLTAFIKCIDEYEGGSENLHDWRHPLVDKIDQIVRITGLCPEIVEDWRAWVVKKQKKAKVAERKEIIKETIADIGNGIKEKVTKTATETKPAKKEIPIITAKEKLNNWLESLAKYTKPCAISITQEQLDSLLCYATIPPTGDYGFDRTKYDSYEAHNFGFVAAGIPENIIAHNAVSNEIWTKIHEMKRALTKVEIDEIVGHIIELSRDYPPMNDIKATNIENIVSRIEKMKINSILWTVKEEEYKKADNAKILTKNEIDELIDRMIEMSKEAK